MKINLKDRLSQLKGEKNIIEKDILNCRGKITKEKTYLEKLLKARVVISSALKETQKTFKVKIETIVTTAIRTVYTRDYSFKLDIVERKDGFNWKSIIVEGDYELDDPKKDVGGGLLRLIGFSLSIIFKAIEIPQTRNLMILDEPFSGLGVLTKKAGSLLSEISKQFKMQFIIITHDVSLALTADKAFHITHDMEKSTITELSKYEASKLLQEGLDL